MAITRINVGTLANDGTGDDLRQAFVKVNNNIDDLDARVQNQATAQNLGGGTGIFYSKENGIIGLKSLVAGNNVQITNDENTITISNEGSITIQGTSGTGTVSGPSRTLIVQGNQNINTTALGNTISVDIDPVGLVSQDTNPTLGGPLNANSNNIVNAGIITANAFTGALTGTVDGLDITAMYNEQANLRGLDAGPVVTSITSGLDFLISQSTIDFGSITSPSTTLISDFGAIA